MRLALLIATLKIGGAERHLVQLLSQLKDAGHHPLLILLGRERGDLEGEVESLGIEIYRASFRSLAGIDTPWRSARLLRTLRAHAPDLLSAHLFHAEFMASYLSRRLNKPLVVTRHHDTYDAPAWKLRWLARILPRGHTVIAVGESAAREAIGLGAAEKDVHILPNAYDDRAYRAPSSAEEKKRQRSEILRNHGLAGTADEIWFGSVGNLRAGKGFHLMIEAAAAFLENGQETARFWIVGDGPERRRLEQLVRRLGLEERVHLAGKQNQVAAYLRAFDFYLSCSASEGLSLAVLEAAGTGLPMILSPIPGNAPLAREGWSILLKSLKPADIAVSLRQALGDGRRGALFGPDPAEVARQYGIGPWFERYQSILTNLLQV